MYSYTILCSKSDAVYHPIGSPQQRVELRSVSIVTHVLGSVISSMSIPDHSHSHTSSDNVLAYHPYLANNSTALIFINLEAVLSCYHNNEIAPICNLFAADNFQQERCLSKLPTLAATTKYLATARAYGVGVVGFPKFDTICESNFNASLVCLLPPALPGWDITST